MELCSPCGESAMEYRRCQPPCVRFIARNDPHSKCVKCLGLSKCRFCENLHLITLCLRCVRRSHPFFPVVLRRPPRLHVNPRSLVIPRPGVRMLSSRRWRVSRQASPFLSRARSREFTSGGVAFTGLFRTCGRAFARH